MKKFRFYLVFTVFLLAYFSLSARKKPKITYVPKNVIVLDTVEWHDNLSLDGTFKILNSGDSTLLLSVVTTTCPCFEVDSVTSCIEPGDTGIVHAVFHPRGKGRFNQAVIYTSNALPEPRRLYLRGFVE